MWIPLRLSPDRPRAIYISNLLHIFLPQFFFSINSTYWDFFFNLSRALAVRQHLFVPNAAVNKHMFSLFTFPVALPCNLLGAIVKLHVKFIPSDKMCKVFKCACVLTCIFSLYVQHVQCESANMDTHGNLCVCMFSTVSIFSITDPKKEYILP